MSRAGTAAAVIVDRKGGDVTYASAHDLRRSYGLRWSRRRITTAELKELMRHESIETTMNYYVASTLK